VNGCANGLLVIPVMLNFTFAASPHYTAVPTVEIIAQQPIGEKAKQLHRKQYLPLVGCY